MVCSKRLRMVKKKTLHGELMLESLIVTVRCNCWANEPLLAFINVEEGTALGGKQPLMTCSYVEVRT